MHRRKPARTASPTVRQLIALIDASGQTYCAVCHRAGMHTTTLSEWKHGVAAPNLLSIEAVIQTLGYELVIVPRGDQSRSIARSRTYQNSSSSIIAPANR